MPNRLMVDPSGDEPGDATGHAFLSYVREDSDQVDRLHRALQAAGISVWRDTHDLWPGQDWKLNIRRAISNDALVFIACFSRSSLSRITSYQNEELVLAIDQLRLRPPDRPWLIPVRFDDCKIPDLDVGGGRTLASIQRADLFGDTPEEGLARLVAAILGILRSSSTRRARDQPSARVRSGLLVRALVGHAGPVYWGAFSPDGALVATASGDRTVRLWDPATGLTIRTLVGHSDAVYGAAFSPDGRLLATASQDGTARLWDPATGTTIRTLTSDTFSLTRALWGVAFSPDGRLLATTCGDQTTRLWDPATGTVIRTLTSHAGALWGVAFSPDGKLLATASSDQTVRLWDPATGIAMRALTGHTDQVYGVAFSPDGKLLATASQDGTVRLWDPASGATVRSVTGHTAQVSGAVFSPDGTLLATSSNDQTTRLWG